MARVRYVEIGVMGVEFLFVWIQADAREITITGHNGTYAIAHFTRVDMDGRLGKVEKEILWI